MKKYQELYLDSPAYNTRSKIDNFAKKYSFDESSKEWLKNKNKGKNCVYTYKT
tara:strand:+ start:823 stop:981 length:159 start_codon:yes stop_codon:yes gene_type:complete